MGKKVIKKTLILGMTLFVMTVCNYVTPIKELENLLKIELTKYQSFPRRRAQPPLFLVYRDVEVAEADIRQMVPDFFQRVGVHALQLSGIAEKFAQKSHNLCVYFFPFKMADPIKVIHLASHGDMNMPWVVSISSTSS